MKKFNYKMHHQWITAGNIGKLLPIFMQEVTPGDTWKGRSTGVFRMAPMDYPAYMSLNIYVHFFFVKYSDIWDSFEDEITGADTPTWPTITQAAIPTEPYHYFGLVPNVSAQPDYNLLPFRAYNRIYNTHFRPHLHIAEADEDTVAIHRVYFPESDYYGGIKQELQQGTSETVDSSGATINVTDIRDGMNMQRLKERRANYGERYEDMLRSDYGVNPPMSRLDRPEHLARAKTTMGISEVVATATSAGEETGEYKGHGIAGVNVKFPKRHFTEHGIIVGVMYARPRLQLKKRCDKMFLQNNFDDMYIPSLSTDSPVTVDSLEVYNDGASAAFGYQDRYEHLRSPRDTIAGVMTEGNQDGFTAHVELSSTPTVSYLQQVQDYDYLFQDQTSVRADVHAYFDHRIGKSSVIKPRNKR
jgi:hypothetical protein